MKSYDVIVVGGGPAGCAAAVSASRHGANVLLIESGYALGGMGTVGMVACFAPFTDGEKICYGGIALEVLNRIKEKTWGVTPQQWDWVPTNTEALKRIYDDLVLNSGVHVLFGTMLCDVEQDETGHIQSILCANKNGLVSFSASVYVDGTGDADMAFRAGVPCQKGGKNGDLQPASLCFMMSGVNVEEMKKTPLSWTSPNAPIHAIATCGEYPDIVDHYMLQPDVIAPGTVCFNAGHLYESDGSDPEQVSNSMMKGRRIAEQLSEGLKKQLPAVFGDSFLVETAPALGVRESRRIQGEYTLTFADYASRRTFEDDIARNCYAIDIHTSIQNTTWKNDAEGDTVDAASWKPYQKGESHGIPYRCLLPVGVDNLLVAGRSISTDRIVNSSVRVMPCCLTVGQAAGTAAALSVANHTDLRKLDVSLLRKTLQQDDGIL